MKKYYTYVLFICLFLSVKMIQAVSFRLPPDSLIINLIDKVKVDSVESYIQSLQDMETRFLLAANHKDVAFWIKNKFESLGVELVRVDSFYCETIIDLWNLHFDTLTWQYNVIATLPGIENPDEYYVIGAHYDDITAPNGNPMLFAPGADDNASGVAALFEIARIMTQENYFPKKNIEFVAFAAEELLHYGNSGSEAYVARAIIEEMDIQLMINNDMIAYDEGPQRMIEISNYVNCEWLTSNAVFATENYTDIGVDLQPSSVNAGGDCKYFYEEGIPVVYFMEQDFNPHYHSVDDVIQNCELDYCAEAIKISMALLVLADNPITATNPRFEVSLCSIYPNPAYELIFVKSDVAIIQDNPIVNICTLNGKTIMQFKICNEYESINIRCLPAGIYAVQVLTDNYMRKMKLVVR